jgi:hypothetical protein
MKYWKSRELKNKGEKEKKIGGERIETEGRNRTKPREGKKITKEKTQD